MPFFSRSPLAVGAAGPSAPSGSSFAASAAMEGNLSAAALFSQAARGGAFLAARYGLGVLVSLGNMLVMTWWIGPHAYGLFVTAAGLVTFFGALARMGVDVYLVRAKAAPDQRSYGVATTLILAISTTLTLAGLGFVPLLIRWYGSGEFVGPYIALLLTVPLTALAGVPTARLERDLNFTVLAGVELGGQSLGLVLAAAAALCRFGVWAPVSGYVAWQVFILAGTFSVSRLAPRLSLDKRLAREMLAYGFGVTASLRAWELRSLINPLVVGRIAGVEAVAFVAVALRIAEAMGSFRRAAARLVIATLSRLQNRRGEFGVALERALCWQIVSLGPLLCIFGLLGPLAVRYVMGARWMPSLALYPFIAAGVLVNSVYNLQASALFVLGRHWVVMRAYALNLGLLGAGAFVLLPRFGIRGYGWAEIAACAAYGLIHAGLRDFAAISYRRLLPWLVVFLALLFASSAHLQSAGAQLILVPTPVTSRDETPRYGETPSRRDRPFPRHEKRAG